MYRLKTATTFVFKLKESKLGFLRITGDTCTITLRSDLVVILRDVTASDVVTSVASNVEIARCFSEERADGSCVELSETATCQWSDGNRNYCVIGEVSLLKY